MPLVKPFGWFRPRAIGWALCMFAGAVLSIESAYSGSEADSAAGGVSPREAMAFNIPSQPLSSALEDYSKVSGREALYNSNLTLGRTSHAVAGVMTPDAALERLLDGTGLSPRYLADRSFVLLPLPEGSHVGAATPAMLDRYYSRIQRRLREALCANDRARPGHFRLAAMLWINASGVVERHERLDSPSTRDANDGIDAVLDHLAIGEPPPAGFAQPVTIAVVPQAEGVTMGCNAESGARAQSRLSHD